MCRGSARFVSRCRGELSGRSLALLRERPFPKSALKRVWRRKAMRQVQSLPASEACVPPSPIPLLVPFHAHLCCDAGGVSQQKKVQFYTHQVRTSELAEVKLSHVLAANAAPGPSSRSHAKGPEESSGASTLPPGPAQPPFRLQSSPESARKPLLHTRGISRARSFDLEVTPWAPTRLTSCISHPGPEEGSGASTLPPGSAQLPAASNFLSNRQTDASSQLLPCWEQTVALLWAGI